MRACRRARLCAAWRSRPSRSADDRIGCGPPSVPPSAAHAPRRGIASPGCTGCSSRRPAFRSPAPRRARAKRTVEVMRAARRAVRRAGRRHISCTARRHQRRVEPATTRERPQRGRGELRARSRRPRRPRASSIASSRSRRARRDFINTVAEAAAIVRRIGNPALRTMIDTLGRAAMAKPSRCGADQRWMPTGADRACPVQRSQPPRAGAGRAAFAPVFAALGGTGIDGGSPMEPFDYVPDGPTCCGARASANRGIMEAANESPRCVARSSASSGRAPAHAVPLRRHHGDRGARRR